MTFIFRVLLFCLVLPSFLLGFTIQYELPGGDQKKEGNGGLFYPAGGTKPIEMNGISLGKLTKIVLIAVNGETTSPVNSNGSLNFTENNVILEQNVVYGEFGSANWNKYKYGNSDSASHKSELHSDTPLESGKGYYILGVDKDGNFFYSNRLTKGDNGGNEFNNTDPFVWQPTYYESSSNLLPVPRPSGGVHIHGWEGAGHAGFLVPEPTVFVSLVMGVCYLLIRRRKQLVA